MIADSLSPKKSIIITEILKAVAEYYQMSTNTLIGKSRAKNISQPRQIAMYLMQKLTENSTTTIGKRCGNRDHATVIYGINRIKECLVDEGEDSLRFAINSIIKTLASKTNAEVNFSFGDMLKIFSEEPPSEEFCNVIFDGGSCFAVCDACGRIFFNNDASTDHNIKELQQLAIQQPEKYHNLEDESVGVGMIDGFRAIYGCPCNFLRKYERLFFNNRLIILEYLKNRRQAIQSSLDCEANLAAGTNIVENKH